MKFLKIIFFGILTIALIIGAYSVYQVQFNYNFKTITKDKVYLSGAIPPENLPKYITDYNIKTIVDLRKPNVIDPLNPALSKAVKAEKVVVHQLQGIKHINIPSKQIPSEENLDAFYKIIEDPDNYPLLIHCHHGTGRAVLYSALYRIEIEQMSNEEARKLTRFPLFLSNFDHNTIKGEWLKNYTRLEN